MHVTGRTCAKQAARREPHPCAPSSVRPSPAGLAAEFRAAKGIPSPIFPAASFRGHQRRRQDHHGGQARGQSGGEESSCLIGGADTFRAAAIEQLEVWGTRANVDVITRERGRRPRERLLRRHQRGGEAWEQARPHRHRRSSPHLGRPHARARQGGQRHAQALASPCPSRSSSSSMPPRVRTASNQAKEFNQALDLERAHRDQARRHRQGGIALAISNQLGLPIFSIGRGETIDDLQSFDALRLLPRARWRRDVSNVQQSHRSTPEHTFAELRGKGRLTKTTINRAMRDIPHGASRGPTVNYRVVKEFVTRCKDKCLTSEVMNSLTPRPKRREDRPRRAHDLLGSTDSKLVFAQNRTPNVIMLVGLQGSGKTTAAAKLAYLLKAQGRSPLLAACDTHRPAAADTARDARQRDWHVGVSGDGQGRGEGCLRVHPAVRRPPQRRGHRRYGRSPADRRGDDGGRPSTIKRAVKPDQILMVVDAMTGQDIVNVVSEFADARGLRRA